jgi:hypothetical protein
VLPFVGLLRQDDLGFPVVILPGSVYVTAGTTRRATGTHYTPRSLTEPIVQHTLEPLVYQGPAEGWPKAEWQLRQPGELLALKVCDMAMGSAGFLVQVVRYLSEQLVEAWARYGPGDGAHGDVELAVFGEAAATMTPEDRLIYARRLVAERCVYGVDKNPLAVEIAKLSLWLVTMAKDRPFTFLNHALKCGDSLVGASTEDFLRWANRKKPGEMSLDQEVLREELKKASRLRKQLESFVVRDVQDAATKDALLQEADAALAHIRRGADLITGVKLLGLKSQDADDIQLRFLDPFLAGELDADIDGQKYYDAARALNAGKQECIFHWELEFPEVFEKKGFSAFIGNPPFIGGTKISTAFGTNYLKCLQLNYPSFHGRADYCSIFFLKGYFNTKLGGSLGLIATNTIAQGDTRETGLEEIRKVGGIIYKTKVSMPWPGEAAVFVSVVHIFKGKYYGDLYIDEKKVLQISASLDDFSQVSKPEKLSKNSGMIFNGSKLDGIGFVLDNKEADSLITKDRRNIDVVYRYLGGEDINSQPDQIPNRWVINFFEWDLEQAERYSDCINIIRQRVLPQRQKHSEKRTRDHWWQFQRVRPELYHSIANFQDILVVARVTKYIAFVFVPSGWVYNEKIFVINSEDRGVFSVLQSNFHNYWVLQYSSTLGEGINYAPSDCFETFPFPINNNGLYQIGETLHEYRRTILLSRQEGLTATYNRFHNPDEHATDIARLRELHVEMDNAVAAAYGWEDLVLGHGFHETAQGTRYTISEAARREVLARLLKLNHERYEEEQRQAGLQEKPKKAAKDKPAPAPRPVRAASAAPAQFSLIPDLVPDPEPLSQPALLPAASVASAPAGSIGSWDQAICLACGKHLVGYLLEEHTKTVHGGVEPGYRKV